MLGMVSLLEKTGYNNRHVVVAAGNVVPRRFSRKGGARPRTWAIMELDELYSYKEAYQYVRERLREMDRSLSQGMFRKHIHDTDKPWYQLEPIRLGESEDNRAVRVIFTRRLLDEYIANLEHNSRYKSEKIVARPTPQEVEEIMDRRQAIEYMNARFVEEGIEFVLNKDLSVYYSRIGKLVGKQIGQFTVFLKRHAEAFVQQKVAEGGWEGGVRPGPKPSSN